jgi:DNA-binding NtrC family response regulator
MASPGGAARLVGCSVAVARVRAFVARAAFALAPVLIEGETGVGKEIVARALHEESPRRAQPFVAVNCSAIPAPLFESLLFGHEHGAFTGTQRRALGHLERAAGGTLFLDEIGELALEGQAKLLRALETRDFLPVGASADRRFEGRVIGATNMQLSELVRARRFRKDLYYRLNVLRVRVPALAARLEDLPDLVEALGASFDRRLQLTEDAYDYLGKRRWPGNVRELRNILERASVLAGHPVVDASQLAELDDANGSADEELSSTARTIVSMPGSLLEKLESLGRMAIDEALRATDGNTNEAARLLQIDRRALERRRQRGSPSDDGHFGA